MPSIALPTSEQIQDAALSDSTRCQSLVLQIVEYGTTNCDSLQERTQEACTILSDAWENCLNLEDTLVAVFWLKSSILASTEDSPSKEALIDILKALVKHPDRNNFWKKLQGNLQPSIVEAAGLGSEQELLKKMKMHNTQVHYKQQKYNLLQEESEGYAKALHFFTLQESDDPAQRRSKLLQLIGTFELDPNRLLDLTLDILEAKLYPNGKVEEVPSARPQITSQISRLLDIMKEFSLAKLQPLIGFKLSSEEEISQASLGTIAFLAVNDLIDLPQLVRTFFEPIENDVEEAHKVNWTKEKKRIQGLTRVSLSGAKKENPEIANLSKQLGSYLTSLEKHPFLRMLLILLEWGEWSRAKPLLPRTVWSQLCTLMPEHFGGALCNVTQKLLQPWHDAKFGSPGLSKPWKTKDVEMSDNRFQMTLQEVVQTISDPLLLTARSGCIASHPTLFCQLCRILTSLLGTSEGEHDINDETYDFFKSFLVPSISLFPSNPALSTELWALLKRLPYATRYRLYSDWIGSGLENARQGSPSNGKPLSNVESEIRAGQATRYVLKRLSKDNIRDMSRQIAKVTHSNPLVVFTTILQQIESYDNMVEVMVEAQRYVNPLGLDVLGYCILSRLSGMSGGVNRSRLKGTNKVS
jgi:THO complex subunit 2